MINHVSEQNGVCYAPVAVSNRHIHLATEDIARLFGAGYKLKSIRALSQPGQFVCDEKVSIVGKKGCIEGVRVLGPVRAETQVEISITDSYILGLKPVVRMSGDIEDTPGATIIGPAGEVIIPKGVIISARHLHISNEEARIYGIKNGDVLKIRKDGIREMLLGNIFVRAGEYHRLEVHIDTDEGNAAGISSGEVLMLER